MTDGSLKLARTQNSPLFHMVAMQRLNGRGLPASRWFLTSLLAENQDEFDEAFGLDFDSADRLFLTDKGRETLSPTKMRRLSYLVPLEHVAAVNSMVNEYLMGVQNENRS